MWEEREERREVMERDSRGRESEGWERCCWVGMARAAGRRRRNGMSLILSRLGEDGRGWEEGKRIARKNVWGSPFPPSPDDDDV